MKGLSIFDRMVYFLNTLLALVLGIAIIVSFIPVKQISSLSVVSLVVPLLVIVNLVFVLYWLLRKKRNILLSVLILLVWLILSGPFFLFNSAEEGIQNKSEDTFSIMSFNARSFNYSKLLDIENVEELIYDFVSEKDPDIVCFQETLYALKRNKALSQYKYKFVDFVYGKHSGKVIQAIYSKFPILNIDSISFPRSANNAIFADILIHSDTVRVYNVHLQSFKIDPELYAIQNEETSKLFGRLSYAMRKQYEQADLVRKNMYETNYNKIVLGDFNNTQYSNIYKAIKRDMTDTFLEKGSRFGRTYDLMGFPLRIDYILADPEFEVLSHQNFEVKLSDHYPIMATLKLPLHE